jgi:GntP family gluconate:H+ symporter
MWGMVASIPAVIAGYLYAVTAGSKLEVDTSDGLTFEELKAKFPQLPSPAKAFAPIIVPLILIGISSVVNFPTMKEAIGVESNAYKFTNFIGQPMIALFVGVIFCFLLPPKITEEVTNGWIGSGVREGASIIMITAAGGSLGAIISATGVGKYIGETLAHYEMGIFLPFIISAALKTAQGSSTVALVTTSTIIAPLLPSLGLGTPSGAVLATLAIGCGAMVVSHANDSYFWVVAQFSNMKISTAYRAQTVATLIEGVVGVAGVWVLSLFLL